MATMNPFDLLGDDDSEDPSQLIAKAPPLASVTKKAAAPAAGAAAKPSAKLPTKPPPPSQAVREARNETGRGGGRGGRGSGRGRGGGGFNRDSVSENSFGPDNGVPGGYREERESGRPSERRVGPRSGFRGGRRGGFSNGEDGEGERPRRIYERRSGTGRGNEFKREGAGRGNWGATTDEIAPEAEEPVGETVVTVAVEKQTTEEENVEAEKENPAAEPEEKEPEEKQMTLEEYEKVLEEKRKALQGLKTEERRVVKDKEFESMQMVSKKKIEEDIFIKLGSEKDRRKEATEKEERAKKSVSINEFLKPAEGETYYRGGGRGRGRGRGRGGGGFGGGSGMNSADPPPIIEDPSQFPTLGAK